MPKPVRILLGCCAALLGAGVSVLWFGPENRADILPLVRETSLISDKVSGGRSDVALDSVVRGIRFRYVLPPGEGRPWAGIKLGLSDSQGRTIDLTKWDRLELKVASSQSRPVRIQLLSDDLPPGATSRDTARAIYHVLEFRPDGSRKSFVWSAFWVPGWWQSQRSRMDIQRLELLDRLRAIEFHSGDAPGGGGRDVVEIEELELVGPDRILRGLAWILVVVGGIGLLWQVFRRLPTSGSPIQSSSASLVPDPLILDDPRTRQREQLVQALRETFNDPDLSLDSFAERQGISPRLVATLIKEATQLHFKGALNELRLTEAARLLKDSRANISEIAYAVGFQSPSHFGRAFREKHGVSPTEYRSGEKSPDSESSIQQN